MSPSQSDDDRSWAAEKRDFVADTRDDVADARDMIADARDARADARDSAAHARELELDRREREVNRTMDPSRASGQGESDLDRKRDRAARAKAKEERAAAQAERAAAKDRRDEEAARRFAEGSPALLALAFAQIADRLYQADSYDDVLTRIAQAAVATVAAGDVASVTLCEDAGYRTVGATGQQARDVDEEQYEADEGPSLDALRSPLVDVRAFPDERWPVLGSHPLKHGVASCVSYRLATPTQAEDADPIGSLNIYATTPEAFDASAIEIGTILAAHASLAARAVDERLGLQDMGRHLQQALMSRDVIGQAKGIIMERLRTTPDEAFEILKRASQRLNVKLREVALQLTETGQLTNDHDQGQRAG